MKRANTARDLFVRTAETGIFLREVVVDGFPFSQAEHAVVNKDLGNIAIEVSLGVGRFRGV